MCARVARIAHIQARTGRDRPIWRQVRSVFFVTLIPCALSHALCSACALVSAAVLGRLAGLCLGVDILITRDIRLAPANQQASSTEIWSGCR